MLIVSFLVNFSQVKSAIVPAMVVAGDLKKTNVKAVSMLL